jgi:threonine dehydrogenase-like Zn-dependent dehydrogenase
MKAALLYGPEDLRVVKVPDPIPGSGEVVVRVVCYAPYGTDLQAYRGEPGSLPAKLPAGIGADFSGVITAIGYRVTGFVPGDRVVACTLAHCGQCLNCRAGRSNLCLDPAFAKVQRQTACQEHTLVPANKLAKLDPAISFEDGAMTWSVIDALNAAEKLKPQPDETVAVIGVGAMSWGAIALFKALGSTVIAVGGTGQRADLARKVGADVVIPLQHHDEDVSAQVMAACPGGIPCIFETTATDWGVRQGFAIASVGGRMAITGSPSALTATGWDFVAKELAVYGVKAGHHQDIALELLRRKKIDLKPTVTHRMGLDEAPAAFRLLTGPDRANVGRVMINVTSA